ncbi:MAG: hypothetical protein Q8S13_01070, partial [Dehalococcoidia bacterium]|nr:hypothetical protein [Dehalococcoidia bacterium]
RREDDAPRYVVVEGNGRHIDAEEANRRLAEAGETDSKGNPMQVRLSAVVEKDLDDSEANYLSLLGNMDHLQDKPDPVELAVRYRRLLTLERTAGGEAYTVESLALDIGVSPDSIKYHLAILGCSPKVQQAFRERTIPLTSGGKPLAASFAEMSRTEQDDALAAMIGAGATSGPAAREAVKAAREGRTVEPKPARSNGHNPDKPLARRVVKQLRAALVEDDDAHDGDEPDPEAARDIKLARDLFTVEHGTEKERAKALRALPKHLRGVIAPVLKGTRKAKAEADAEVEE